MNIPSGVTGAGFNPILAVDSYKQSHHALLPPGTSHVESYIESRGGQWDRALFFGLQFFLKTYLATPVTAAMIDEAEELVTAHGLPFNRAGWEIVLRDHGGMLPLRIRAVPEGSLIPGHNVLAVIRNTDPRLPWLTSFIETALLRAVWYPTTVATLSWHIKQDILGGPGGLRETSDDPAGQIGFRLHDFGARGVSSGESAGIGGAAHLVNFMGTDTMEALVALRRHYAAPMAGFSIPATEHSVITAWGRDGETAAYTRMLDAFGKPGALIACVSDSYDLFNAIQNIWGGGLRERIETGGFTLVVRPDSGDPARVPTQALQALAERFPPTLNGRGFRVLPSCVRVIQGDGINQASIRAIQAANAAAGFSAENISYGMGGALLQGVNRDTLKFAMKASAVRIDGTWRDVFKDPATDPGKRSKAGRLALIREDGRYETVAAAGNSWRDLLTEVWRDGELKRDWTFDEVRARASAPAMP